MITFKSVGHFFASVAHDVKVEADATVKFLSAHQAQLQAAGQVAATIVSAVDPALAPIAAGINRAGEALLGEAFSAVQKIDAAANAPVNITLDIEAVNELKTLFKDFQNLKGLAAVPPVGLA